jgi:hypothetical protein
MDVLLAFVYVYIRRWTRYLHRTWLWVVAEMVDRRGGSHEPIIFIGQQELLRAPPGVLEERASSSPDRAVTAIGQFKSHGPQPYGPLLNVLLTLGCGIYACMQVTE